jgi:hypothetical protein
MSDVAQMRTIRITTMRSWKSGLEQLGAEGDLELLRAVADQRLRQEAGDGTNSLSDQQIGLIEGLTGIKAVYDEPATENETLTH